MVSADVVIVNGKVATVDRAFSFKEAIAVKDGWIIDVGTDAEIKSYIGPGTETIDLCGKLILPAAHDSHMHGMVFALNSRCFNCGMPVVHTLTELQEALAAHAEKLPEGAWIRGVNLNAGAFPECEGRGIARSDIDAYTCGHPAILLDWSGHGTLVNSEALALSGLDRDTKDPTGGFLVRDAEGELTGYLQEASAMHLVFENAPLWSDEEMTEAIFTLQKILNREGYSGFTESTLGPAGNVREYGSSGERGIYLYKRLADEGKLTVRVAVGFYSGIDGVQSYEYMKHDLDTFDFPNSNDPMWFKINMMKVFADGVHLFHSGWLLDDYADMPGSHGSSCLLDEGATDEEQAEELGRIIELAHCRGYQIAVHAIGDRAIEESLNAIIAAKQKHPGKNPRHYILHAESLGRPEQAAKAARYIIPYSVQPAISDHAFEPTIGCIGPRGERSFDLKTLLDEGVFLCGGSDAIAGVFPHWRMAVQSALTRRSAITGKVYSPELCITVEDAVRMYTINAVYQEHMEEVRGSIEPGKAADFQVLDRDIFQTPADEIGSIGVVMTMVDGKVVYEKGNEEHGQ